VVIGEGGREKKVGEPVMTENTLVGRVEASTALGGNREDLLVTRGLTKKKKEKLKASRKFRHP